jgi:hypothetical protein
MTDDLLNPPEPDYHEELVGEGKKFKDDISLAKGKYIADKYIETLENQLDQLREEYSQLREENVASAKLKDLINQTKTKPELDTTIVESRTTINPKDIESLIDSHITQREKSRKETENLNMVRSKLEEKFGKNYQESLQKRIEDLDLSHSELNSMTKTNPKSVIKLLGLDEVEAPSTDIFRTLPRSSQTTTSYKPSSEKRTWAWYQNLKQTDPKKYHSRETNVQMHKDALQLGSAFEDGDFSAFEKDYRISF